MSTAFKQTSPRASRLGQFLHGQPGVGYMIGLALTLAGYNAVEQVTAQMIPITCRKFTDSAFMLSVIIALNAVFGFVAQPYIAWRSDHLHTRIGRRRPFMLLGFCASFIAVGAICALPYLITGDARFSILALAILMFFNIMLQCFQDVVGGAMEPLLGDTFSQEELGRVVAWRNYAYFLSTFSIGYGAMKISDEHEWAPYAACLAWLALSILLITFFVRERPSQASSPAGRYNPLAHLSLLISSADYLRVAVISTLGLVLPAIFNMFNSLFVTQQLGMTRSQLADTNIAHIFVTLFLAFPIGYMVDRFGPKWMMALGFLTLSIASTGMAYFVHSFPALFAMMTLNYVTALLIWGPMTSMVFQYASPEERGTVFGLVQFTRAFMRFLATLFIGVLVQFSVSYEPTLFLADDFKRGAELVAALGARQDPISSYLADNFSDRTVALVDANAKAKKIPPEVIEALRNDLNRIIKGAMPLDRFAKVKFSGQSRTMLARKEQRPLTADESIVLNRSLIIDAYPNVISKKVNYRVTYVAVSILGIFAILLVLTSKPGKYARTLRDTASAQAQEIRD